MKRFLPVLLLLFFTAASVHAEPATKDDLKTLVQFLDKRFELIDKRFESIDKRFEFIQNLIIALIAIVIASPFAVEYMARRRTDKEREAIDKVSKVVTVLRELSEKDPKIARAMHIAGLS